MVKYQLLYVSVSVSIRLGLTYVRVLPDVDGRLMPCRLRQTHFPTLQPRSVGTAVAPKEAWRYL